MMADSVTLQRVLDTQHELPAFPQVVLQILETLDDPDACLTVLAHHIERDPIVAARVLSLANRAGNGVRGGAVNDVFTAISLVGLGKVREVATLVSMHSYLQDLAPPVRMQTFWGHSLATALCGVELARHTAVEVCVDASLIACLLHDVGQLWLHRFESEKMALARQEANARRIEIDVAEREQFGVDHCTIGGWLAQHWGLSDAICQGITHHHAPLAALPEPLVAIVHVAEVLGNALDLAPGTQGHVSWISNECCALLGIEWGPESQSLFGRIEASSRHAFLPPAPSVQHGTAH
jgi:HD-like signal output (HDOD) protein